MTAQHIFTMLKVLPKSYSKRLQNSMFTAMALLCQHIQLQTENLRSTHLTGLGAFRFLIRDAEKVKCM